MRLTLEGSAELKAALANMSKEVEDNVREAVIGTALSMRGKVTKAINSGPASGRTYQKYNPRRTHTASAPGQAPMSDQGRLAGSVYFDADEANLSAEVGSLLAYAAYLEYGTTQMAPRPVWQPTLEEERPLFQRRVEKAVGIAIK